MSYNLGWIAVRAQKAAVLNALGLEEDDEITSPVNEAHACAELPGGWLVVTGRHGVLDLERTLAAVSAQGLSIGCEMSEIVMVSRAVGFIDGRKAWTVLHDPDKDVNGVEIEGEPPAEFAGIVERLKRERAADQEGGVDYLFDGPIDLAFDLAGFRPDKPSKGEWIALERKSAERGDKPERSAKSFSSEIKGSLVPLIKSFGFQETRTRRDLFPEAYPYEFFRVAEGLHQVILLEFGRTPLHGNQGYWPWAAVAYSASDPSKPRGDPTRLAVAGSVSTAEPPRQSLWRSITGLFNGPRPAPEDPTPRIVDEARDLIIAVEAFLSTGARAPRLGMPYGVAKDTWPDLPR